jgi:hypothetical protein
MTDPWWRFYCEMISDRKFKYISKATGLSKIELIGAWAIICTLGHESPIYGALLETSQLRVTVTSLSEELEITNDVTGKLINAMIDKCMLKQETDGTLIVVNLEKRQYKDIKTAKRMQKYRDKLKDTLPVTSPVTLPVTTPETETETETEVVVPRPNIYKIYESEIGGLTPMLSQELDNIEKDYPEGWFELAVKDAKKSTTRVSLNYVLSILKRYKADGLPSNGKKPKRSSSIMDAV